ncbi:MAG: PPOX class F420-dependent oxidoreductase, partial [Pseudomonadales bacterium]
YISFATFRKSGVMVNTPVWAADAGDSLYVFSESKAGKVKRLRNSSKSRVATCTMTGKVTGEWYDAEAVLLDDEQDIDKAHRALKRKYGWQMWIGDFFARLNGRINKRAHIEIKLV